MARYARESVGTSLDIVPIARPFSNFDFVDREFAGLASVRRVFSQIRLHGGKTMVVEELDVSNADDLREENEDVKKRCSSITSSRVRRLSFFGKSFSTRRGLHSTSGKRFLGYAIIKEDFTRGTARSRRIYESVVPPSRRQNNFIRGAQRWRCRAGGITYRTIGYLYAQQNNMTNVCAHVACRTVAAGFHGSGDMTYREMNDLPGIRIDHVSRTAADGLRSDQMVEILEAAGARCVVGDYTQPKPGIEPPPFQKYLYGSIESGFPAIVCFATAGGSYHAVPLFGHTFNEDTWVPRAEHSYFRVGGDTAYIPSESWLSTFVAHDDNWGSNYCIPRRFLHTRRDCEIWPEGARPCPTESECVAYVIATLPKATRVNSIDAEVIAADYLFGMLPQLPGLSGPWQHRLCLYARSNLLVLRPILIESGAYARHIKRVTDWNGNRVRRELIDDLKSLPDGPLWMVELSVPELFSANRRKVAEVLLRADVSPSHRRDVRSFLLARLPGYFALYKGGGAGSPTYRFIPSGIQGHVELFGCECR